MSIVLVTGAAGFIGSHVVDELLDQGHEVIAIDNLNTGNLDYLSKKAIFIKADIRDEASLETIFKAHEIDYVVHEAAIINTNVMSEEPLEDVGVSVIGSLNLILKCQKYKIKKMVFASSVAVYGTPDISDLPAVEDLNSGPIYSYGFAKQCAENYFKYYAETRGLSFAILRYGNIYGPRQPIYGEVGVIAIFSSLIADNKSLTIFGDGSQQRDFLYVKDAVRATVDSLWIDENLVLNIGSGKGTSVNEVLAAFELVEGRAIEVQNKELRVGEIGKFYCSNKLAMEKLNWKTETSLEEGLKMTLEFERTK